MLSDSPRGSGFEHSSFFSARMVKELMQPLGGKSADRGQISRSGSGRGAWGERGNRLFCEPSEGAKFALCTHDVFSDPGGTARAAGSGGSAERAHNLFPFTAAEGCAGCRHGARAQARIPRGVLSRHQSRQLSAPRLRARGAQIAFETCLFEACARSGWVLHTFVVMGKHDQLAVQTRTTDPRIPMLFLIQYRPTPPASRPLRPTDSSRIPQSRFLGEGLITAQRIFSTRSAKTAERGQQRSFRRA